MTNTTNYPFIPLCEYPTTVLLVDDNHAFLENLAGVLQKQHILCHGETNPEQVMPYLTCPVFENNQPNIQKIEGFFEGEQHGDHPINVNALQLHRIIYQAKRFNDCTTVVLDYAMQGLDGEKLAKQIREQAPNTRIIMLTGEADYQMAVNFCNEGLIDHFLQKSTMDLQRKLCHVIQTQRHHYFITQQKMLVKLLCRHTVDFLVQQDWIEQFFHTCQNLSVVEYYLLDGKGSFLLADGQGNLSILAVKDTTDYDNDIALAMDEKAPDSIVNTLQQRQTLLFSNCPENYQGIKNWENYLSPATKLPGKNDYYYALIRDLSPYAIDAARILPYQTMLDICESKVGHGVSF